MKNSHYIFDTEQEAIDYEAQVTNLSNYKDPANNWAEVRKHPTLNKWAVVASPKLMLENQETIEGVLPSEWFPTIEE